MPRPAPPYQQPGYFHALKAAADAAAGALAAAAGLSAAAFAQHAVFAAVGAMLALRALPPAAVLAARALAPQELCPLLLARGALLGARRRASSLGHARVLSVWLKSWPKFP